MHDKKKLIKNIVIFLLLIIITFWAIFKNHDLKETIDVMLKVEYKYILLAAVALFLDISFESINIKNILSSLNKKVSFLSTLKYTIISSFFSGITPAAGGGQPMEIYYMKSDGIKVADSTLALLVEVCSFHIVTITWGIFGAIYNYKMIGGSFLYIFITGLILKSLVLTAMLIGIFSKKLSKKLANLLIEIMEKFKYQNIDNLKETIASVLRDYDKGSSYIKTHKNVFIKSLIIVFFQVLMYNTITYFIYRSFGFNTLSYFKIMSIQALFFVSISSIPLPGMIGISESAFMKIYTTVFCCNTLTSAMLLQRGITFYLFMIVSLVVVIISTNKIKNKKKSINQV